MREDSIALTDLVDFNTAGLVDQDLVVYDAGSESWIAARISAKTLLYYNNTAGKMSELALATGEIVVVDTSNANLETQIHHPVFQGRATGAQSWTSSDIYVDWDSESYKEAAAYTHSTSTNPSQITIDEDGEYVFTVQVPFTASVVGNAIMQMQENIGAGFVNVTGTVRYEPVSTAGARGTLSFGPFERNYTSGDIVRFRLNRYVAGSFQTVAGEPHIRISQRRRA